MNKTTWGELRRVAGSFRHYCEITHTEPTPENCLRWLADTKTAGERLGYSLTQAGELPVATGRPE